jgi:hypothetical protein
VRIRTLFAVATGAALGAGSMFLLDPEHGRQRRRQAAARAVARGRRGWDEGTRDLATRAGGRVRDYAGEARRGFEEAARTRS